MRAQVGRWGALAAAAGLAAGLFFSLAATGSAGEAGLQAEPLHGARRSGAAAGSAALSAGNTALCGKCHSACEAGRTHEGRTPAAPPEGAALPLADGRTTCATCHESHRSDGAAHESQLRVSNLRRELCLACHREDAAAGPSVRVVSPPERSITLDERVALIGTASGLSAEPLSVRINGGTFHLPVKGEEFLTWLTLLDGVNRVQIAQGERVLWAGEVFRGEGATSGYSRRTTGHCTGSREECRGCHDEKREKIAAGGGDLSALCYGCHDRFDDKRYLHGPLAVGACLACHDPHSGYGTAHLRADQRLLCEGCHAARGTAATAQCNDPRKTCADCHDPHQSDSRYLLKEPKYTLRDVRRAEP